MLLQHVRKPNLIQNFSTATYLKYSFAIWTSLCIQLSQHSCDTDQQHINAVQHYIWHLVSSETDLPPCTRHALPDSFTRSNLCLQYYLSFEITPSRWSAPLPSVPWWIFCVQLWCSLPETFFVHFTFKCSSGPIRFNFSLLAPGQFKLICSPLL